MIKKIIKSNKHIYYYAIKIYNLIKKYNIFEKMIKRREFIRYINGLLVNDKKQCIYCLLEPEHGNIGDIALGYAQKKFLEDYFPECTIIDITAREYNHYKKYITGLIGPDDILVLIGGGSLGDQYIEHESSRREIINSFKDNFIISFPQSMYFSKTSQGARQLQKSIQAYSSNSNLILIARDSVSYGYMKENFTKNKVLLTPDIVFYLNNTYPKCKRKGVSLFLRNDVEGSLTNEDKDNIYDIVKKSYSIVSYYDTKIDKLITRDIASIELQNMLQIFKKSELVITDRLHGMIFATITSTPCIVLANYNHKIEAQYKWIKHINSTKFCDEIANMKYYIENIQKCKTEDYNNNFAVSEYQKIVDCISKHINQTK